MELCEGCDRLIDMKQAQGDYVYYRKEYDQVAHPFCNVCLEKNDYGADQNRDPRKEFTTEQLETIEATKKIMGDE